MNAQINTRSPQLYPLRSEHKDGILFVNRLRYGLNKISIERLRSYTLWYWKNHIRPHFFQEEKILLPYIPIGHHLAVKLKDDHDYIRELVLSVDHEADALTFKMLCDLIDAHIRFEEQYVFGYLEEHLTLEELNLIYEKLEGHPVTAEEWDDPYWNERKCA